MMKASLDRTRDNVSNPLDQARVGCILPERDMRPHVIIIGGVFHKDSSKVLRVERDQILGSRIIVEIGKRRKITMIVIVPPHEGLGTRDCSGIERPQVGVARKDSIADAKEWQNSRGDRNSAKPLPIRLLRLSYALSNDLPSSPHRCARGGAIGLFELFLQLFERDAGLALHPPAH